MVIEIIRKYWFILMIGLILRLVVAGLTFHPDLVTPAKASAIVFQEKTLDFYGNSFKVAPGEILDDLPLSYLISLPFHGLIRPLVSEDLENIFFANRSVLFGLPNFWFYLIYIKFPFIIFDLSLGILLVLIMEAYQKKILTIWMFNPITLWVALAIGQADIYPSFFILLSFFFLRKNNLNNAALSLGFGGAIKSAPFLLVPLLIGFCKTWRQRLTVLLLSIIPYLVTVIPYLGSSNFKENALFAPQLSKMLYATIPLSGIESIFIVPTFILFLYLIFFSKKQVDNDFLSCGISIFLAILMFTHFHMQWLLWAMPFLLIWHINNEEKAGKLAFWGLIISWVLMLFLFESSLQMKLFAPIFPYLDRAIGLNEILSTIQGNFLRNIAATIFAGSSIYIIYTLIHRSVVSVKE